MRITGLRVHLVKAELQRPFWMSLEPYTMAAEVIVEVHTDEGLIGLGQIHGRPQDQIARIIKDTLEPILLGKDPLDHQWLWEQMFRLTISRQLAELSHSPGQPHFGLGARPQLMAALAGVDIALWDIKGKALHQPVWRLLGGGRREVPAYASGGYYNPEHDCDRLVEEMQMYASLGYGIAKLKVGGVDLAEDVRRIAAVRTALPELEILADANGAYDVKAAIAAARAFEELGVGWFEEPVHWYETAHGTGQVARATRLPIAGGESEFHRWGCRDLMDHGGVRFMQFDCTRAGGVTEWLRVAAYASARAVRMAPHHDPQVHGHLVAGVENGYMVEVFPNPERDPLWADLFLEPPQITRGVLLLTDRPGFGIELDPAALRRYAYATLT